LADIFCFVPVLNFLCFSLFQDAEEAMLARVCITARIDRSTLGDDASAASSSSSSASASASAAGGSASAERRLRVLDLGCGWGSFSLYVATKHPHCDVTAVSNSNTQRAFIEAEAARRGLKNLKVITKNVVELKFEDFPKGPKFDRVCSTEMFEHMKVRVLVFSDKM
jgi:cyclopropane fatty-acyl-phospholipid synthase-like methyltransferase